MALSQYALEISEHSWVTRDSQKKVGGQLRQPRNCRMRHARVFTNRARTFAVEQSLAGYLPLMLGELQLGTGFLAVCASNTQFRP
jgi:hypothetical protein